MAKATSLAVSESVWWAVRTLCCKTHFPQPLSDSIPAHHQVWVKSEEFGSAVGPWNLQRYLFSDSGWLESKVAATGSQSACSHWLTPNFEITGTVSSLPQSSFWALRGTKCHLSSTWDLCGSCLCPLSFHLWFFAALSWITVPFAASFIVVLPEPAHSFVVKVNGYFLVGPCLKVEFQFACDLLLAELWMKGVKAALLERLDSDSDFGLVSWLTWHARCSSPFVWRT